MTALWRLDATELAQGIRTRRFSSREATAACLARCEAANPKINAVVDLLAEQARADGLIPSLGPAIRLAQEATLSLGWYGTNDDDEDQLCDEDGWTTAGEAVRDPKRCVLAVIDLSGV